MQNAFSAGPLHSSLPTLAAGEPVAGIVLGIVVFGDRIQISSGQLALEAGGIAALIVGVVMVARSSAFGGLRKITDVLPHPGAAEHPAPRRQDTAAPRQDTAAARRQENLRTRRPDTPARTHRREELNGLRQDPELDGQLDVPRPRRAPRRPLHGPASGGEGG
jgi:hypothetical protein